MGFSLSSLYDPAGITTGDKGDWVNNLLDPVGGTLDNWGIGSGSYDGSNLHDNIGNWMDDMADTNSVTAQDRWNKVKDNPQRMLYTGGDLYSSYNPVGTRIANKWEGDSSTTPAWNIYGDATPENYQHAEEKGIDTSNAQGAQAIGSTIGKGVLNYFTLGLGSTVADAADSWGNYDNAGAEKTLKNGAKNYAINYLANGALDYAGGPSTLPSGSVEGSVGSYQPTSTGYDLGKTLGAGEYSGVVNSAAKSAAVGGINAAAQGGNRTDIAKGAGQAGLMTGAKQGADAAMGYLSNMYNGGMPDTGTLGGNMYDENGENSATMGGEASPTQIDANKQATNTGFVPSSMPLNTGGPNMKAQSVSNSSSPVSDFLSSIMPSSGGGGGGGGKSSLGGYGDLASSLFGLYNANQQRRKLQEQQDSLSGLFSPNSPYAQQMRQNLERKDAAGGRRSQYGPREAQLAALLADRQAQTMPQQMKYADAIGGYNNQMAGIGIRGVGSLYDMYRNRQQPQGAFGSSGIPFRPSWQGDE